MVNVYVPHLPRIELSDVGHRRSRVGFGFWLEETYQARIRGSVQEYEHVSNGKRMRAFACVSVFAFLTQWNQSGHWPKSDVTEARGKTGGVNRHWRKASGQRWARIQEDLSRSRSVPILRCGCMIAWWFAIFNPFKVPLRKLETWPVLSTRKKTKKRRRARYCYFLATFWWGEKPRRQ